jgi:DNA mismatch endonuclease, patch repair protein
MADTMTKKQRSKLMGRIRSSGTKPEKLLRRIMEEISGVSVSRNVRKLPGTPDLYLPGLSLVVFMDGCFWHRCPVHGRLPKSRSRFWEAKLSQNVERDRASREALRHMGMTVWSVWEHDLKPDSMSRTRRRLRRRVRRLMDRLL